MNKFKTTAFLLAAMSVGAWAQHTGEVYDVWSSTDNAAGIGRDTVAAFGRLSAGIGHTSGDFHRVQEGGVRNEMSFSALKYQSVGQYIRVRGTFDFRSGRTKDRAWCDVMRPYESNPFISGSSIRGRYDHQDYAVTGSIATLPLRRMTYGINFDYRVSDLSRLRDPRSRVLMADYKIAPAVTLAMTDNSVAGLEWHYRRRKEKLTGLATVQSDPSMAYYVMTGLDNAVGTVGGYSAYSRQYVSHRMGGELSYRLKTDGLTSLTAVAYEGETEYVSGANKYEPGRFFSRKGSLLSENRIPLSADATFLVANVRASHSEAYADEYKQELVTTKDAVTGIDTKRWHTVIKYAKRYQLKLTDVSAQLRLERQDAWYAGVSATLHDADICHVVPDSRLAYRRTDLMAEGMCTLRQVVRLTAAAGYSVANKAEMELADAQSDMAVNVLLPDMDVLSADAVPFRAKVEGLIRLEGGQWLIPAVSGEMLCADGQRRQHIALTLSFVY